MAHPDHEPGVTGRRRVFIVEDEAVICMYLADRLADLGYECCGTAARAEEAVPAILEAAPDVVLMDVNLGPGPSGLDVAERLSGASDAGIIVLTAYTDAAVLSRAASSGSWVFLSKPIDMAVLAANIELVLARRASKQQLQAAKRELERLSSLLHAAFEATADGLLVIDRQGIQMTNPQAGRILDVPVGIQPDGDGQLLRRMTEWLEDPTHFAAAVADVLDRSISRDGLVVRTKDGRHLELACRPQAMHGLTVGCVVSIRDVTGRHRAESELRESQERYRTLFEDAPVALAIADASGRPLLANAAMRRLRDTPPDTVERRALFETHTVARMVAYAREEQTPYREHLQIRVGGGREIDVIATVRPVTLRAEPAILWMLEDVTERLRTQAALEALSTMVVSADRPEEFFQEVARHVARLLDCDAAVVTMRTMSADGPKVRTVGLCVDDRVRAPLDLDPAGTPCASILHGAGDVLFSEDPVRQFPGLRMLAEIGARALAGVALRDSRGNRVGSLFVATRHPLDDRAPVESMLRLFAVRTAAEIQRQVEERRFHDLFEFSPDATLLVNETGGIIRANRRAEELFGYSAAEFTGATVEQLLRPEDRERHVKLRETFFRLAVPRLMGEPGRPLTVVRKDGTTFPADIGLSPVRSHDGIVMAVDVRDVSERLRHEEQRQSLEAQLRQSQKMEAIGTLAGGIAHDFNNLLAAIVANLDLARGDVPPDHPVIESLDAIGVAAARARQLVQQIVSFSRRHPPQRAVLAPGSVLDEVVRLVRATVPRGISIRTVVRPDAPVVFADATQLHQVLMNLATNAWHAIEHGRGEIAFTVDRVQLPSADHPIAMLAPGDYARFTVADSGRGMTPDVLDRIFEPFFTTKAPGRGSGLGLSVVHGIVSDHRGGVAVESQPGAGTTVSVYLPASEALPVPAQRPEDLARGRGGRVAFVDDEPEIAATARRLLARLGYTPTVYVRPGDLIEALECDAGQFDLVITDCNMPEISGLDVARKLASLRHDLPLILMSGFADRTEDELESASISVRLDKPFSMQELHAAIQRAMFGEPGRTAVPADRRRVDERQRPA